MGNCLRRPIQTQKTTKSNPRLFKEDVVHSSHIPHEMYCADVIHVKINATAVRDVEQAYIKLFKCMSEIVDENSLQHSVSTSSG